MKEIFLETRIVYPAIFPIGNKVIAIEINNINFKLIFKES